MHRATAVQGEEGMKERIHFVLTHLDPAMIVFMNVLSIVSRDTFSRDDFVGLACGSNFIVLFTVNRVRHLHSHVLRCVLKCTHIDLRLFFRNTN